MATRTLYLGIQRNIDSLGTLYASVHRWDADTGDYIDQFYPAAGDGDADYTIDHLYHGPNGRIYIGMGSFVGGGSAYAKLVNCTSSGSEVFNINWPVATTGSIYYSNIYSIFATDNDTIYVAPWCQNTVTTGYVLWQFDGSGSAVDFWLGNTFQSLSVTSIVNVSGGVIYHTYGAGGPGDYATYDTASDAVAVWGPTTDNIYARQLPTGTIAAYNRFATDPSGAPYSIISADGTLETAYVAPTTVEAIQALDILGVKAWAATDTGLIVGFDVGSATPTLTINPADTFPDYVSNFGTGRWNTNGMMVIGPAASPGPVLTGDPLTGSLQWSLHRFDMKIRREERS